MNPRASRCSRALQRPIVSSKDGLWITDSLLAQVFEDYCLVSRAWNRRASHVPGPLESQRRLGRRRMGDLNALYYPPTPPPWEFAIPLDFSNKRRNRSTRINRKIMGSGEPVDRC